MGDLSTEPSMEDILSSIKRIIAEEGDQPARRARPQRATPAVALDDPAEDEVLELSDPMPMSRVAQSWPDPVEATSAPSPRAVESAPVVEPPRAVEPSRAAEPPRAVELPSAAEPIVSNEAAAASRGALESLSRLMIKPEPGNDGTLEGLVREMIRPMLREWLDANLPDMVEKMVSREIARIAGQAG